MERPEKIEKNNYLLLNKESSQMGRSYVVEDEVELPTSSQEGGKPILRRFRREQIINVVGINEDGVVISSPHFLLNEFVAFSDLDKTVLKLSPYTPDQIEPRELGNNGF